MKLAKLLLKSLKWQRNVNKYHPYRTRVVMELHATEMNYVSQLDMLVRLFVRPLKALAENPNTQPSGAGSKPGFTIEQVLAIFGNVEEILEHHRKFLDRLSQLVEQWEDNTCLGALVGLELCDWLVSVYSPYCNAFDDAKALLAKCMKIPAFQQFIELALQSKELKKLDVASLMILPIQRIPRYELLLKDLFKHTWPAHPDHSSLQQALTKIKEAAVKLNRAKAFSESRKKIMTIKGLQSQHSGGSLAPSTHPSLLRQPSMRNSGNASSDNSGNATPSPTVGSELEERYIGEGELIYQELTPEMMQALISSNKRNSNVFDIDALLKSAAEDESDDDEEVDMLTALKSLASAPPPDARSETSSIGVSLASTSNNSKPSPIQQVFVFMFQDTMIITKRTSNTLMRLNNKASFKYQHWFNISLENAVLDECETSTTGTSTRRKEKEPSQQVQEYYFLLTTSDEKIHKFTAETPESKRKWIADIKEAFSQLKRIQEELARQPSPSNLPKSSESLHRRRSTADFLGIGTAARNATSAVDIHLPDPKLENSTSLATSIEDSLGTSLNAPRSESLLKSPLALKKLFKSSNDIEKNKSSPHLPTSSLAHQASLGSGGVAGSSNSISSTSSGAGNVSSAFFDFLAAGPPEGSWRGDKRPSQSPRMSHHSLHSPKLAVPEIVVRTATGDEALSDMAHGSHDQILHVINLKPSVTASIGDISDVLSAAETAPAAEIMDAPKEQRRRGGSFSMLTSPIQQLGKRFFKSNTDLTPSPTSPHNRSSSSMITPEIRIDVVGGDASAVDNPLQEFGTSLTHASQPSIGDISDVVAVGETPPVIASGGDSDDSLSRRLQEEEDQMGQIRTLVPRDQSGSMDMAGQMSPSVTNDSLKRLQNQNRNYDSQSSVNSRGSDRQTTRSSNMSLGASSPTSPLSPVGGSPSSPLRVQVVLNPENERKNRPNNDQMDIEDFLAYGDEHMITGRDDRNDQRSKLTPAGLKGHDKSEQKKHAKQGSTASTGLFSAGKKFLGRGK